MDQEIKIRKRFVLRWTGYGSAFPCFQEDTNQELYYVQIEESHKLIEHWGAKAIRRVKDASSLMLVDNELAERADKLSRHQYYYAALEGAYC